MDIIRNRFDTETAQILFLATLEPFGELFQRSTFNQPIDNDALEPLVFFDQARFAK